MHLIRTRRTHHGYSSSRFNQRAPFSTEQKPLLNKTSRRQFSYAFVPQRHHAHNQLAPTRSQKAPTNRSSSTPILPTSPFKSIRLRIKSTNQSLDYSSTRIDATTTAPSFPTATFKFSNQTAPLAAKFATNLEPSGSNHNKSNDAFIAVVDPNPGAKHRLNSRLIHAFKRPYH